MGKLQLKKNITITFFNWNFIKIIWFFVELQLKFITKSEKLKNVIIKNMFVYIFLKVYLPIYVVGTRRF